VDVQNMSNGSALEALWAFGAPEPKKVQVARSAGRSGGKGTENSLPRPPFSATFSQIQRLIGKAPGKAPVSRHLNLG
jgi:hypothetical protein